MTGVDWDEQAYSKLIVTCSTFVLYTHMFTKSANNAIEAMETAEGDQGMAKRLDTLSKFETNFDHWYASVFEQGLLVS